MGCCCGKEPQKMKKKRAETIKKDLISSSAVTAPTKKKCVKKGEVRYLALWDYRAASKAEVALNKGDILEEEMEERDAGPEWVFVSRVSGSLRGTGYAPRAWLARLGTLEEEPWYFGDINRRETERILSGLPDGAFLVRSRQGRDNVQYAMSIARENATKHYKIKTVTEECSSDGGKRQRKVTYYLGQKKFESIHDMIDWFQKSADGVCCVLTTPPPKPEPVLVPLPADVQQNWQEIPRSQVIIEKSIGSGNFGVVYKGIWKPKSGMSLTVAVKELKPGVAGARKQFLREAVAMKNLVHERLVKLHGVVSSEEPFWIVAEYVNGPDLKKYLKARKQQQRWLDEEKLVSISCQIADGMRYLESKNLVHRDLAARNVLAEEIQGEVERDITISVKITDFGMAKMVKSGGIREKGSMVLPVKWTAPEALVDLKFYTASDVWSFGVLLHEIFTHGDDPYKGMKAKEVKNYVLEKKRIFDRDENIPSKIYELITICMNYDHKSRPSFQEVYDMLEKYFDKGADPYERYRQ